MTGVRRAVTEDEATVARFGDGLAVDADLVRAAESAAIAARGPLGGLSPDLACVFVCGSEPDQVEEALQRAASVLRARTVIGCSASGVIGAAQGIEATSAVSVWAAVLPGVRVRAFHLEVIRTEGGMAILGLPESEDADEVAVVVADPYSFPADGFVEQANTALALPLVGGLATGSRGPGSTRLLIDGRVVDRGAVGVVLGGPVGAQAMVSQGCRPVGPAMTVTAAEGNLLLELAGIAAVHKARAGDRLAVVDRSGTGERWLADRDRDGRVRRGARARRLPGARHPRHRQSARRDRDRRHRSGWSDRAVPGP